MKKISMILTAKEKAELLKDVQESGLIEIIKEEEKENPELEEKLDLYYKIKRVSSDLLEIRKKHKKAKLKQESYDPLVVIKEYDKLHSELVKQTLELERLQIEETKLKPWGSFHMEDIHRLREHGVYSHFYSTSIKNFNKINFENLAYEIITQDKKLVHFVVFSKERLSLPAVEVSLPEESLNKIVKKILLLASEISVIHRSLFELTAYIDILLDYARELKNSITYVQASDVCRNDETGSLIFINAWLTAKSEKELEAVLQKYTLWYEIEEPSHEDNPPVHLKNNWFIRPFEVITKIFSLPSYFEFDPTPLFAPFFMLFFGLCMADMGYGLLVMIALAVAYFKVGPDLKPVMKLGMILGGFTVLGGYWLNTFFGFSLFQNSGIEEALVKTNPESDFLASFLEEGKMVFPAISFSIVLGFLQVSFGIFVNTLNRFREKGVVYGIQPISYLVMIISILVIAAHKDIMGVASVVIGNVNVSAIILKVPEKAAYYMLFGGLGLLFFFNNVEKKVWVRPPMALWELYNFVSGLASDILSYLRLFALGLAGGLLGGAFNKIAFMVMKDSSGVYSIAGVIGGVVIMLLGHSLNLILAIMGAFVHSLRLTFVEFYKNLQFEGGGKPFTPFRLEK